MTSTDLILTQTTDMLDFPEEMVKKAGEQLGCQMDRASCIRALIIQQDTGLSMARGEISVVPFKGKPQVFINRQGYLAYANRQQEYDGFESGTEEVNGRLTAWCKVYRKDRRFPASVRILFKEFGKTSPVWQQMPEYMLEKTAISLALRMAFPILNGTLSEEERDAPYTITPRDDDIDVTPQQVPAPAADPQTQPAKNSQPNNETNDTKDIKETNDTEKPQRQDNTPAPAPAQPAAKPPKTIYSKDQVQTIIGNMQNNGLQVPGPDFFDSARMPDGMFNGDIINAEYLRLITLKNEQQQQETAAEPRGSTQKPEQKQGGTAGPAEPNKPEQKIVQKSALKEEPKPKQTKPTPEPTPTTPEREIITPVQEIITPVQRIIAPEHGSKTEVHPKQTVCPVCGKPSMTADQVKQLECLADSKAFERTLCKDCATKWWEEHQERLRKLDERMPRCKDCGMRVTEDEARRSIAKFGEPVCPDCWIRRYSKKE